MFPERNKRPGSFLVSSSSLELPKGSCSYGRLPQGPLSAILQCPLIVLRSFHLPLPHILRGSIISHPYYDGLLEENCYWVCMAWHCPSFPSNEKGLCLQSSGGPEVFRFLSIPLMTPSLLSLFSLPLPFLCPFSSSLLPSIPFLLPSLPLPPPVPHFSYFLPSLHPCLPAGLLIQ